MPVLALLITIPFIDFSSILKPLYTSSNEAVTRTCFKHKSDYCRYNLRLEIRKKLRRDRTTRGAIIMTLALPMGC